MVLAPPRTIVLFFAYRLSLRRVGKFFDRRSFLSVGVRVESLFIQRFGILDRRSFSIAIFTVCFLSQVYGVWGFGEEDVKQQNLDIFDRMVGVTTEPVQFISCVLEDLLPGEKRHVTIFLRNNGMQSFEMLSVATSCGCTKASVPQVKVDIGQSEKLDFDIHVNKHPLTLFEDFDATIRTSGSFQVIRVRMHANYRNLVTFGQSDFLHTYGENETASKFKLPIKVSDPNLILGASVVGTEGLKDIVATIIREKDGFAVVGEFKPKAIDSEDVAGELKIQRGNVEMCSVLCLFQKRKSVELLPQQLSIVRASDKGGEMISSVIFGFATQVGKYRLSVYRFVVLLKLVAHSKSILQRSRREYSVFG